MVIGMGCFRHHGSADRELLRFLFFTLQLRPTDRRLKKPERTDLVYVEDSPDYCNYDPASGSLGEYSFLKFFSFLLNKPTSHTGADSDWAAASGL